jgi:hypothetical protein
MNAFLVLLYDGNPENPPTKHFVLANSHRDAMDRAEEEAGEQPMEALTARELRNYADELDKLKTANA